MPKTQHLVRRWQTWYIRLRVPSDLRPAYKGKEITRSLKTRDFVEAKKRLSPVKSEIEAEFEKTRQKIRAQNDNTDALSGYSDRDLIQLTRKWFSEIKRNEEAARIKMKIPLLILWIACLCSNFMTMESRAQDADKDYLSKIGVGDTNYIRGQIISDFLSTAFPEKLWFEYHRYQNQLLDNFPAASGTPVEKDYPWLKPYISPQTEIPKSDVITKWKSGVTIGYGWPYSAYNEDGNYFLVKEQIKKITPVISNASGRDIQFISPTEESKSHYGRIRIVISPDAFGGGGPFSAGPLYRYGRFLWSKVNFETSDNSIMRGFLLPDSNNEIGLVVCTIAENLEQNLLEALVTECIVRGMGLPGLYEENLSASVLGNWRESFAKSALVSREQVHTTETCTLDFANPSKKKCKKTSSVAAGQVEDENEDQKLLSTAPSKLSPQDILMIRLLYCESISSGMSKNEVVSTLVINKKCQQSMGD